MSVICYAIIPNQRDLLQPIQARMFIYYQLNILQLRLAQAVSEIWKQNFLNHIHNKYRIPKLTYLNIILVISFGSSWRCGCKWFKYNWKTAPPTILSRICCCHLGRDLQFETRFAWVSYPWKWLNRKWLQGCGEPFQSN